jgi:hypothetical protein
MMIVKVRHAAAGAGFDALFAGNAIEGFLTDVILYM